MDLAESLGKTLAELRTGRPQPLSNPEFVLWRERHNRQVQLDELAIKSQG